MEKIIKAFLKKFAVVKPIEPSKMHNAIIKTIDSLWLKEYQNHILIILENQIDLAKKKGMNPIYIADDIIKIDSILLKSALLEIINEVLNLEKMPIHTQTLSFVFYDKRGNNDDIYIGTKSGGVSIAMIKSIIFDRWYDYEVWDETIQ